MLLHKINHIFNIPFFYYCFLLNLVSSSVILVNLDSLLSFFLIFTFSITFAYFETTFITLFPKIRHSLSIILIIIYNILIIIDYFLLYKFDMVINNTAIDIVTVTNIREIIDFTTTYISPLLLISIITIIIIINVLIYKFSKYIANFKFNTFFKLLTITGICIYLYAFSNLFLLKQDLGLSIPQYNTISRLIFSYHYIKTDKHIGELRHICKNTKAIFNGENKDSLTIIVVIGESHNLFHSSLYGYEKETNPLLNKRAKKGELIIYNNAITTQDLTSKVMESVFSLDSLGINFNTTPLFPACFKAAGFYCALYDNEYFKDKSTYFLCNNILSDILFDKRNTTQYEWDNDMIQDIEIVDSLRSLYIIHLVGQHYAYNKRSPNQFKKFTIHDYENKEASQRQTIADYDNACLYNDFIINEIIKKFEKKNACLIYFSDHGEEMYDNRNYCGHGTARNAPDIRYQMKIPCFIWISEKYKHQEAQKTQQISNANNLPISTDDISHTILDLGCISTEYFNPQRSFINIRYNLNRQRLILDGWDYDKIISNYNIH